MRPETRSNLRLAIASTLLFAAVGELLLRALGLPRAGLGTDALGTPLLVEALGGALAPYQIEDRALLWRLLPGAVHVEQLRGSRRGRMWAMTINGRGRRGPHREAKAGAPLVLCIGDSVTMGYGADDLDSYPESLQSFLEGALPGVAVVNAGSNGYSSEQGRAYLEELVDELAPAVVIVCFGANDDAPAAYPDARLLDRPFPVRSLHGLLRASRIYEVLRKEIVHRRLRRAVAARRLVPRVPPERYRANLSAMVALCRARGAAPLLVAPPSKWEHFQETAAKSWPAPISVYRQVMSSVAHEHGVAMLDHPLLSGRLAESEAHFLDWCHPDARALCLLAEHLSPLVKDALQMREPS